MSSFKQYLKIWGVLLGVLLLFITVVSGNLPGHYTQDNQVCAGVGFILMVIAALIITAIQQDRGN